MALGWIVGCAGQEIPWTAEETTPRGEAAQEDTAWEAAEPVPGERAPDYGYTYSLPSGNRVVEGEGDLPNSRPVDIELGGEPAWVVGVPLQAPNRSLKVPQEDTAWVVALVDGRVEAFLSDNGEVKRQPVTPETLPPGAPPIAGAYNESLRLLVPQGDEASDTTHPVPTGGGLLYVADDGWLVEKSGEDPPVWALPDARPVLDAYGRIAVLSEPTERYLHGVIGDDLEAESISVLGPGGTVESFRAESGGVFEALAPLWFEPQPGEEELLAVTESTADEGTRVSVYHPDGQLVAAGPFIGEGMRWRHLLAAGPFGPDGEIELTATRTPHVGGEIEFYRPNFETGELEISATISGYTTHRIYSRNLDAARAGDLDGDGHWELLVPDESYTELGAIRRAEGGAGVAWELPVGGTLATNIASARDANGRISVAVGRTDGVLRIWP